MSATGPSNLREEVERAKEARQASQARINALKEAHYQFVDSIHKMIAEREKALWAEIEKHGDVVEKLMELEARAKIERESGPEVGIQ